MGCILEKVIYKPSRHQQKVHAGNMILDGEGARKVEVSSIEDDSLTTKRKHLSALRAREGFTTPVAESPIGSPARLSAKLRILKIMHPDRVTCFCGLVIEGMSWFFSPKLQLGHTRERPQSNNRPASRPVEHASFRLLSVNSKKLFSVIRSSA